MQPIRLGERGRLYSYTVVYRSYPGIKVPFISAIVDLEGGGCLKGNELSLSGNELHVRFWNQKVPGSSQGAWFAAASYETMCVDRDGRLLIAQRAHAGATRASVPANGCDEQPVPRDLCANPVAAMPAPRSVWLSRTRP